MDGPGIITKAHTAVLLGEKFVGKTSFLKTITNSHPDQLLVLTEKVLNNSITFSMHEGATEAKLQESLCILFMYDITNPSSIARLKENYSYLMKDKNLKERCFLVLLGNKADLDDQRKISTQEGEIFASQYGMFFLEISNVSRKNVELVQKVMRIRATHLLKKRYSSNLNYQSEKSGLQQYDSDYSRKDFGTAMAGDFQSKTSEKEQPQYFNTRETKPEQRAVGPIPHYHHFLETREKLTTLELSDSTRRTRKEQAPFMQLESHMNIESHKINVSSPIKVSQNETENSGTDSLNIRGTPLESERQLPSTNLNFGSSGMKNSSSFRISPPGLSDVNDSRKDAYYDHPFAVENRRGTSPRLNRGSDSKYETAVLPKHPSDAKLISERLRKGYLDASPDIDDFSQKLQRERVPALPPREDDQSSDFLRQFNYNFNRQLSVPQNTTSDIFGTKQQSEGPKVTEQRISNRDQSFSKQPSEEHSHQNFSILRPNSRQNQEARQSARSDNVVHKSERGLPLQQKPQNSYLDDNNISFSHFGYNPDFQSNGGIAQSQRNPEETAEVHKNIINFGNQQSGLSQKTLQRGGSGNKEINTMSPGHILERYQQEHPLNNYHNPNENDGTGYQEQKHWNQIETLKPISTRQGAPSPLSQDRDDFQFISAGTSEKGSPHKPYNPFEEDLHENPAFKESRLSEIDQNIQKLEESLNNIDLNLVSYSGQRGRSFVDEKSFSHHGKHERPSQERVLREKITQERGNQRIEDRFTKGMDIMQDSLNKRTNRFHDEFEHGQHYNPSRNLHENEQQDQENRNPFHNKSSEKSFSRGDENKQSQQSIKKPRSLSYAGTKSPKSDNRLPVPTKYHPVIFIHLEDSSGNIDILPIYNEDTALAVAERYLKHRNIGAQKNVLKRLADVIEEKVNAASFEFESFVSKYEEQVVREKNTQDRLHLEKNLKEAKSFNFETDRRNLARSQDDNPIVGKLYVELENRRVIVLNLRQKDGLSDTAMAFVNTHSISKDYCQLILSHLHQLKQMWQKIPLHTDDNYPVLNLVLKDFKVSSREHSAKDLHSATNSRANLEEPTLSRIPIVRKASNILFKLNLDTGNGRISKIVVREGDNLKRIAHNFTITHKLGSGSYERIHQTLVNASKNNLNGAQNSKQLNSIVYIG